MAKGEWEGAISTLQRGLAGARGIPFQRDLADELDRRLHLAEQARTAAVRAAAARELHQLTDRIRFLYGANHVQLEGLLGLEACCRAFWNERGRIVERLSPAGSHALEPVVRDDLLDLAIFWADLQARLAPPIGKEEARRKALTVLAEAEALFGPSPVLDEERQIHSAPGGPAGTAVDTFRTRNLGVNDGLGAAFPRFLQGPTLLRDSPYSRPTSRFPGLLGISRGPEAVHSGGPAGRSVCGSGRGPETAPHTAWEHYALGRSLLRSGDLERAAEEVERAVRLQPQGLWPNFYQGLCAYRLGRYADAAMAYSVCIGVAPEAAGCFFNRALAFDALDRRFVVESP